MSRWGLLFWLMTGLSFLILLATRYILGGWHWSLMVPLTLFFVGLTLALLIDLKYFVAIASRKSTKDGLAMGWYLLLVAVVLVCINALSIRYNFYMDMTQEKTNTLSPETHAILRSIDRDIKFKAFYNPRVEGQKRPLREIFKLYGAKSSKVSWEFVNTYLRPLESREYLKASKNPDQFVLFAESGGQRVRVKYPFREESLSLALYQILKTHKSKIYFLIGHGERSLDQKYDRGIIAFQKLLQEASYSVASLSLRVEKKIPMDADVVAIIGPQSELLLNEIKLLQAYARQGGRLFLAIDPDERHNLALLTKSIGVEFQNNIVVDDQLQMMGRGALSIMGEGFSLDSPITRDFGERVFVLFDTASGLAPAQRSFPNFSYNVLVNSSPKSFTVWERPKSLQDLGGLAGKRRKSIPLAITVTGPPKNVTRKMLPLSNVVLESAQQFNEGKVSKMTHPNRLNGDSLDRLALNKPPKRQSKEDKTHQGFLAVVFGDSDFLGQKDFFQGYNRDLALNAMAFLNDGGEILGIKLRQPKKSSLILTSVQREGFLLAGILLPVILFFASGVLWWRRRKQ